MPNVGYDTHLEPNDIFNEFFEDESDGTFILYRILFFS